MELTLWTYEGPPHVGAIRIAASMRAHFMGADGFEAGTDVWGIAKKGLKNAPASLWSRLVEFCFPKKAWRE